MRVRLTEDDGFGPGEEDPRGRTRHAEVMRGFIGFIAMLQGALGFIGQVFFDGAWGALHHWFDLPSAGYLGIFAAGAALAVWGDTDRKRKAKAAGPQAARS